MISIYLDNVRRIFDFAKVTSKIIFDEIKNEFNAYNIAVSLRNEMRNDDLSEEQKLQVIYFFSKRNNIDLDDLSDIYYYYFPEDDSVNNLFANYNYYEESFDEQE
jgi:hypothetical protein